MTNDEVERAIEFLLKWQAEHAVRIDTLTEKLDRLADRTEKLADHTDKLTDRTVKLTESTERITRVAEDLLTDRGRIVQLIELQSRRLDRQDSWWKDHEDRIHRLESE